MKHHDPIYATILKEQKGCCLLCGKSVGEDGQLHHAVISRSKRFAEYLDMPENIIILCPKCHGNHGRLSNWKMRCQVYSWKIDKGYDMQFWLDSLPFRVKERFIYVPKQERNA